MDVADEIGSAIVHTREEFLKLTGLHIQDALDSKSLEARIENTHKKIDEIFSTNEADFYTKEGKQNIEDLQRKHVILLLK